MTDPSRPNPQFIPDLSGQYIFSLVVHDGKVASLPARVTLTATTGNAPPNARAGKAQYALVGRTVLLDGSNSSDPELASLQFLWSFDTVPPGSTLTDTQMARRDSAIPTFIPDKEGTYVLRLRVSDGVPSDVDTVEVFASRTNVGPNAAAGPDLAVQRSKLVTLDGTGSFDPDMSPAPLTFAWIFVALPATSTLTNTALHNATAATPSFTPDVDGTYLLRLTVSDGAQQEADNVLVVVDTTAPTVQMVSPTDGAVLNTATPLVTIAYQDAESGINLSTLRVVLDGTEITTRFTVRATQATYRASLADGSHRIDASIQDLAGNLAQATVQFLIDTVPLPPLNAAAVTVGSVSNGQVTLTGAPGSVEPQAQVRLTNTRTGQVVTVRATASGSFTATLLAQGGDGLSLTSIDAAGNIGAPLTLTVGSALPPDPATVAPPNNPTVATTLYNSIQFLFTDPQPIQTGVAPNTITPVRIAVFRGKVLAQDEQPLPGVKITLLNHPEFGQTLSRADGMFDLAVNGGGALTVVYTKNGYFPAQRQVRSVWQDYTRAPDVVLVPWDPQVTRIDLQPPRSRWPRAA
jgi:hypothetical protein